MKVLTGEDNMTPIENETDEARRSMNLMLRSGIIPDANLIHAARKKREMARTCDFIALGPTAPSNAGKSRQAASKFALHLFPNWFMFYFQNVSYIIKYV